jgi:hypothetical protein
VADAERCGFGVEAPGWIACCLPHRVEHDCQKAHDLGGVVWCRYVAAISMLSVLRVYRSAGLVGQYTASVVGALIIGSCPVSISMISAPTEWA